MFLTTNEGVHGIPVFQPDFFSNDPAFLTAKHANFYDLQSSAAKLPCSP
jgi:hypothetical protein